MRPVTITLSSATISNPIVLDYLNNPEHTGVAVVLSSGAVLTYTVQYSFDDPFAVYATNYNTNATWFDDTILASLNATQYTDNIVPCRAVRLNVTSYTSGTATITAVQSGVAS